MTSMKNTAQELESVIEARREQLRNLDAAAAHHKPAPDRWSISEVIGHLVDSACNNHQRFVRAQFVDELTFPKYEQNEWVAAGNYRSSDWQSLVQLWYFYNLQIAAVIRNIPETQGKISCTIEPYEPCTLEFLVKDYLDHLCHHFDILDKRLGSV